MATRPLCYRSLPSLSFPSRFLPSSNCTAPRYKFPVRTLDALCLLKISFRLYKYGGLERAARDEAASPIVAIIFTRVIKDVLIEYHDRARLFKFLSVLAVHGPLDVQPTGRPPNDNEDKTNTRRLARYYILLARHCAGDPALNPRLEK